jgi:TPR repeat protein
VVRSIWQATLICLALVGQANAQDSGRGDWLRNPAMGNYKGYAEFKMGHYVQAREIWQTLAEIGNGDALFNLAILAEDGLGEPVAPDKAENLYLAAARAGNVKAQYRLGLLYGSGAGGRLADVERARLYLGLAAGQGDRQAAEQLALLGQPGRELTPLQRAEWLASAGQHEEALGLYTELAGQGVSLAQTRLAWMYEAGRGVSRDLAEAARRFEIAAEAGESEAQYALAVMYRTGRGRERDLQASMDWLRRAAAQRYPAAVAALASLEAAQSDAAR